MSSELSSIKHLLVDLDGTLLGNRNVPLSLDFVIKAISSLRRLVGFRKAVKTLVEVNREFGRISPEITNDRRVIDIFSRRLNLPFEEARKTIRDILLKIFPPLERHFYPIKGAKDFLDWAKDHYTLTLATNPVWPEDVVEMRVKWAKIDPSIFSFVTDVRKMHSCKPTLEYYREILKYRGFNPEECLLIGNDFKMDLPATKAGIRVFIVGPFKEISLLRSESGCAPAWKGTYSALRQLLEASLPQKLLVAQPVEGV